MPRPQNDKECALATHSRIGLDFSSCSLWDDDDEDQDNNEHVQERTYFLPKINYERNRYANLSPSSGLENSRQWFLIAQASENVIQIFCIPLGWKSDELSDEQYFDKDDENNEMDEIPFYLTTKLVLPTKGVILQIKFYGDDGKSNLSSGMDSGSGMEGKQKIGFIYKRSHSSSIIELWTATYDSLMWQAIPFDSMLLNASQVDATCSKNVLPVSSAESYMGEEFLIAQSKFINIFVTFWDS